MARLTPEDWNKVCYDPWELCGMDKYCTKGCHEEGGCTNGCQVLAKILKLAEYEDKYAEQEDYTWCIITDVHGSTLYLAWQEPPVENESGYFWTSRKIFLNMLDKSTKDHPFIFKDRIEGIKLLKSIDIPQKSRLIQYK